MNKLPSDVLNQIYKYKHELEFNCVMDELLQKRINCLYNFSLSAVRKMYYRTKGGQFVTCLPIDSIDVYSSEILRVIKSKFIYNIP